VGGATSNSSNGLERRDDKADQVPRCVLRGQPCPPSPRHRRPNRLAPGRFMRRSATTSSTAPSVRSA